MVRQAHTYLVGAVSGATLIVVAIAVFVLLVSAQVFRNWPFAALGDSSGGSAAVTDAQATSGAGASASASALAASATRATAAANGGAGGGRSAVNPAGGGSVDPIGTRPTDGAGAGGGGGGGATPTTTTPASGSTPSNSSGGSGSSSGSGGGSGGGGSGSTATTPSGKVTETVNNTVGAVDETVTAGTLENTGVTGVTEGAVEGVLGPESTVGKVVDETVGAVGGILGGGK